MPGLTYTCMGFSRFEEKRVQNCFGKFLFPSYYYGYHHD
jgi:hypothetical protein